MTRRALMPKIVLFLTGIMRLPEIMRLTGILRLTGLLLLIGPGGCDAPCGNMVFQRKLSPDGQRSAVLFQSDCGATAGFSTQISVVDPAQMPTESGNVFIADNGHNNAVRSGPWNGPWAEMEWLAPDHLLIRYPFEARVFVRQDKIKGVKITFKAEN